MNIRVVDEVLVPGIVPVVDYLVSEKFPASEPGKYEDYAGLGMCLAGYGLSAFGYGGVKARNIGIASLDWAVNSVRNMVKGAGVSGRVSSRRLSMSPRTRVSSSTLVSPSYTREGENISLITP